MSKFSKRLVNSLFLASLCSAAPCAAEAPRWEDHALGSTFAVGDITTADGIEVFFDCFTVPGHMPTCTGEATVMPESPGCNYDHRLWLNNINARMELAGSIGPQPDLKLLFGEYGGVINIEINGHYAIFDNFIDAHLAVLGGVKIEVVSGGFGADCGEVILRGVTEKLVIGGQEFWIDAEPLSNCTYDFEDLAAIVVGSPGDTFTTHGIDCLVRPLPLPDGTLFMDGQAVNDSTGLDCGSGQELWTYACVAEFDFAGSIGSMSDVSVRTADHGTHIYVEINGEGRIYNDYIDAHGDVLGGVGISVAGGAEGSCTLLWLNGVVETLALGGGQHVIDCLEGTILEEPETDPADLSGDGTVDGEDLAMLLGAWMTPDGDIDGDGFTDGTDLALLLGSWKLKK